MARVSVIMPAYNAAAYLAEALDSVLSQTFADWEILIGDGGSTDGTAAIVEERRRTLGDRLRFFSRPNLGIAAARNLAIRESTGELLAFLDADDVWLPQRLERGIAALDAQPEVGLLHSRVRRMDRQGRPLAPPPELPLKYVSGRIAGHLYTRRSHILTLTVLLRRACVDRAGLFDEQTPLTEDRDMWFRVAREYPVAYIDEVLALYRMTGASHSSNLERAKNGQLRFLEKHRDVVNPRDYRQGLASIERERGDLLFNRGELAAAIGCYGRAVAHDPTNVPNVYMLARAAAEPGLRRLRP